MLLHGPSMEDLPEHVTVDILSRLPVKTIVHCKCVCKKWRNIVFDSYFVDLHLLRSPAVLMIHHNSEKVITCFPKPGILKWVEIEDELDHHNLHHDPVMSLQLNLAPVFQNSHISPVGSVNGLICLWQFGSENDNYICNPVTREYMILSTPRYYRKHRILGYGFGMGSVTHEYKVIQLFQGSGRPDYNSISEPEVYTIGTGQWRRLGHIPYLVKEFCSPFLNGHAHWTVVDQNNFGKICAFNFDMETFELFPSPPSEACIEGSRTNYQSLGVLKGYLCQCDTGDYEFKIWVMKEYGIKKSWHKDVVIKESIRPDLDWLMWSSVYVIKRLKDGTILMVSCERLLLAYCPRRKTIVDKEIFDHDLNGLDYRPSFHRLHKFENERVYVF